MKHIEYLHELTQSVYSFDEELMPNDLLLIEFQRRETLESIQELGFVYEREHLDYSQISQDE